MSVHRRTGTVDAAQEALIAALAELGVGGRVERRAGLAIVITDAAGAARLAEPDVRRRALAAAREHGFTHLAVELSSPS